jgi:hypothetical protein
MMILSVDEMVRVASHPGGVEPSNRERGGGRADAVRRRWPLVRFAVLRAPFNQVPGEASDAPVDFCGAFPAAAQASTMLGTRIASQKYSPIGLSNCRSRHDVRVGLADAFDPAGLAQPFQGLILRERLGAGPRKLDYVVHLNPSKLVAKWLVSGQCDRRNAKFSLRRRCNRKAGQASKFEQFVYSSAGSMQTITVSPVCQPPMESVSAASDRRGLRCSSYSGRRGGR